MVNLTVIEIELLVMSTSMLVALSLIPLKRKVAYAVSRSKVRRLNLEPRAMKQELIRKESRQKRQLKRARRKVYRLMNLGEVEKTFSGIHPVRRD